MGPLARRTGSQQEVATVGKVFTSLVVGTGEGGEGGGVGGGCCEDTEAIESDNGGIVLTQRWVMGLAMICGVGGCG